MLISRVDFIYSSISIYPCPVERTNVVTIIVPEEKKNNKSKTNVTAADTEWTCNCRGFVHFHEKHLHNYCSSDITRHQLHSRDTSTLEEPTEPEQQKTGIIWSCLWEIDHCSHSYR